MDDVSARTSYPTVVLVIVAVALIACGGGSRSDTAATTTPSVNDQTNSSREDSRELTPAQICTNVARVADTDPNCMSMPGDVRAQCENRLAAELDAAANDPDALAARRSMFQCMGRADTCDGIDMCIDELVTPTPAVDSHVAIHSPTPASDQIVATGVLQCDQPVQWFASCIREHAPPESKTQLLHAIATASQSMVAMAATASSTQTLVDAATRTAGTKKRVS